MIQTLVTFIIVFGIIVVVHEYGHLFFAKRAGILVREFSIGMGPKIFAHQAKDGTFYSIRILPLGGYVRMAGWGDDTTEIKKGTPASLMIVENQVVKINLSERVTLENSVPMLVTEYDFEEALFIEGEVFGEIKRYSVDHDATIIEADGTELRIAPRDVQYQSASVLGKILTNFAGPLNNFILGIIAFIIITFMQGGVPSNTNQIGQVQSGTPAYSAGLQPKDKIQAVNGEKTGNWQEVVQRISANDGSEIKLDIERDGASKTLELKPEKIDGRYRIGITQTIKTGFLDKLTGGFTQAANAATLIFKALGNLIAQPSLDKLGGPVAIYDLSGQAAREGLLSIIALLAMLSINLGIVNLIPIPVLDGGKIVLNIVEALRGKPLSQEKEGILTLVGLVFMVVLMIAVTWNDILRAFIR
ncbi:RIP metalloprotease RseP [Lactococcus garvieae]|uniref:Zinc metalloprotease n=3 Tax=Lactococcus garvieae TaxID=1363 RepID=F9VG61_LACGL|nr:RIP metalloprotease RseP [Lactococcus garvieae]ETD03834.1 metalloprotease RseP [Lactococcus garvieae TRF1]EOT30851.1 RIP metalloprotease RseP [Lactococcus garvieae ATCC 49156]EOT94582.1 RIP metalloprotease RseP [Lactococcus garvieae ATCC 49156]KAA8710413.1 RIP metalloprotease RseP [Lactococcus garvieae subsp. garvieae]MDG6192255.1 RIP metalloprotease RseP [Lactococcus garvieae]